MLEQRKEAKLLWLHNLSQMNGNNLNTVRCETNRCFRNKEMGRGIHHQEGPETSGGTGIDLSIHSIMMIILIYQAET
jgi:hypothetical protein